jgi:hypothetical protein
MPASSEKSSIPRLKSMMGTRNANKHSHPGQVVNDAKQKRRSTDEMKKVRAEKASMQALQESEQSKKISNVAEIEDRLRKEDIERRATSHRASGQPTFRPTADMDNAAKTGPSANLDNGKLGFPKRTYNKINIYIPGDLVDDRLRKEDTERHPSSRRVSGQPKFRPTTDMAKTGPSPNDLENGKLEIPK